MSDVDAITTQANDKRVADGTLNLPHPYKRSHAIQYINWVFEKGLTESTWAFGICLKETDTETGASPLIGIIGMEPNVRHQHGRLGYWIGHTYWNKGYTTEAVKAVIDYGFETLAFRRIYAEHFVDNPASGRVMQKAGMAYEGTHRQHYQRHGVFHDIAYYGILRDEWLNSRR